MSGAPVVSSVRWVVLQGDSDERRHLLTAALETTVNADEVTREGTGTVLARNYATMLTDDGVDQWYDGAKRGHGRACS